MIAGDMDLGAFKDSIAQVAPPAGISSALQALWWDAKGDWARAHACAQAQEDDQGNWVHAYLHRKEGDPANAGYWYRRVRKPPANVSLAEEWDTIAGALIDSANSDP